MEWKLNDDAHTYILRYYLPCLPQYENEVTQNRLSQLVDFCIKHNIGAVMFYVDLNPYWYYMPDSTQHNAYVAEVVAEAAERLRSEGISYQLNYQNMFGSWDGNFDHRKMLPWECYVDEFGRESYGCACMAGEKFRKIAGEKLLTWAKTKPDAIWIDDDIRNHNHRTEIHDLWDGKLQRETLDFGCFCDTHIARFNEKYKTNYTRSEIVSLCLSGDDNFSVRKHWLDFQCETLCDCSKWMAEIVHSVSPDTRLAVMTSNPDVHAVEGRNWNDFLTELSSGKIPLLRPTFGPYSEGNPREFAVSASVLERLKENISSQYVGAVDYCPEIENTRFTLYSKSIAATKYQLMLSAFLGCRGVTLSIFDLEGCILSEQPQFGKALDECKPFCDLMNKTKMYEYKNDGISFVTSPDNVKNTHFEGIKRFSDMVATRNLDVLFAKTGIPIDYCTADKIGEAKAVALDRFSVSILTDDEIKEMLCGSVFADGGAADELIRRGFGEYLGIKIQGKNKSVVSSEILHTKKHIDQSCVIVPSRICGNKWFELEICGAKELSSFVIPDGSTFPGFTSFENSLGGKIVIYASQDDYGDGFFSTYRISLLRDICKYLYDDIITVGFESYGVTAVRKKDNKTFVFVSNLSADNIDALTVSAPSGASKASLITADGQSSELSVNNGIVRLEKALTMYGCCVIAFEQ